MEFRYAISLFRSIGELLIFDFMEGLSKKDTDRNKRRLKMVDTVKDLQAKIERKKKSVKTSVG